MCRPYRISVLFRLLTIALLVSLNIFFVTAKERNDNTIIENKYIRLTFINDPVPSLDELIQKQTGKNLLEPNTDKTLFLFDVVSSDGQAYRIKSGDSESGFIEVSRKEKEQYILIHYNGLGPDHTMQADINGILNDDEPYFRWSLKIIKPGKEKVSSVKFPYITISAIDSPDDDFIIAPAFPGVLIENPVLRWPQDYSKEWSFPGLQSVQFCSYQDGENGIYMASMDTVGYNRSLRIAKKSGNKFVLSHEYKINDNLEGQWISPYRVALGVTSGTWQQTADIYKKWAVNQPWCAKTLVQRTDIPEWWKHGVCLNNVQARIYGKSRETIGSFYPKMPNHFKSLRKMIDGPVIPMIWDWEKHFVWAAGDYFPIFDEPNAKSVIKKIRKDGFFPFFYLSGILFSTESKGLNIKIDGSEKYAGAYVIDKAGNLKVEVLAENTLNRRSFEFCPSSPETKMYFRSVIDSLHKLGVDILQMDQATSGASSACYSTEHGHKPGIGPYQSQSFRNLLSDMRQYGKSLSPDFMLTNEEVHEELIPFLDAFHSREYCDGFWYRNIPGAKGIPLFTYLYHEYAIVYGGEGSGATKEKNLNLTRDHAVNLVTGKMPSIRARIPVEDIHPDQITFLRNHMSLLESEAYRFLILGKMLHPLECNSPLITLQMGGNVHPNPITEQAVQTSSWLSSEGLVGHCFVNISDSKIQVPLSLDTRNTMNWSAANIDLYRPDNHKKCQHVLSDVSLPVKYLLDLNPLEAVFMVMRPSGN